MKEDILKRVLVLEDTIPGSLDRYIMRSLLIFNKDEASNHVLPKRKSHFFTSKKRENHQVSFSCQNCIFGGFYSGKGHAIFSSRKASALYVLMRLEQGG